MLVIGTELKSTKKKNEWLLRPKEGGRGCAKTRWRLPGYKFGLVKRTTNDPLHQIRVLFRPEMPRSLVQ